MVSYPDAGQRAQALQQLAVVEARYNGTGPEPVKVGSTWADLDKVVGPIQWDWPGWLPKGFEAMVSGPSGEGKSYLILRIVSCYLNKTAWPDGIPFTGETGQVLWCETEAGQIMHIDRAKKLDLPLSKIRSPLDDPMLDVCLDNLDHQAAIIKAASEPEVKLIVVDSLSGGTRRNSKNSNEMIVVGKFLAELARDTGKPVLVSHHLRKKGLLDGDSITLDRLRDSSAIAQTARVIWAIDTPNPELPDSKRLYVIKNNLAKYPDPIGLEITGSGLEFGDAPELPKKETQADKARDLLLMLLSSQPASQDEVEAAARGSGISMPTINRVKPKLGIVSRKIGNAWYWGLSSKGEINVRSFEYIN